MTFFNHNRSAMTAALIGIPRYDQDFPLILRYISVNAGQPHGSTFSIQFKWPAKCCQVRSVGERPGVAMKASIFEIISSTADGDKDILPALMSTQKPMIFKVSLCSCLRSSKGQEIDSQSSKSCTWRRGRSLPRYQTRLSAWSQPKKSSM